jgi:hypothetical protein
MKECFCSNVTEGSLMATVLAITPDQYIEPEKAGGIFEPLEERMNDFEKCLYTVMSQLVAQIKQMEAEIKSEEISIKQAKANSAEIKELNDKRQMLKSLMYLSIQNRLNIWNKHLGVSQGFKIIFPDESACREGIAIEVPMPNFISDLLGSIFKCSKREEEAAGKEEGSKP